MLPEVGLRSSTQGVRQALLAASKFVAFDQTKTPGSFPPEVLLEVSRQTFGIRSCAERER